MVIPLLFSYHVSTFAYDSLKELTFKRSLQLFCFGPSTLPILPLYFTLHVKLRDYIFATNIFVVSQERHLRKSSSKGEEKRAKCKTMLGSLPYFFFGPDHQGQHLLAVKKMTLSYSVLMEFIIKKVMALTYDCRLHGHIIHVLCSYGQS